VQPFSQNYSRATLKFPSRFREWCPETGKKADLMFVQHMLASLKADGLCATIMPHGGLFRGGKAENQQLLQQVNARIAEISGIDLFQANGLKYDSPGQRPGPNELIVSSPERATQPAAAKSAKKHLAALQRDGTALEARLAKTDALFAQIGGKLTDEQARTLILTKLHDLASQELNRYLRVGLIAFGHHRDAIADLSCRDADRRLDLEEPA
jgi:hypothetical protein